MAADQQKMDPALMSFIQEQQQRAKFTAQVHQFSDACFDVCVPDKPPAKLDGKTQTCVANCVNRFIDASNFMLQKLQQMQGQGASGLG